jgi:hypothetical protein
LLQLLTVHDLSAVGAISICGHLNSGQFAFSKAAFALIMQPQELQTAKKPTTHL